MNDNTDLLNEFSMGKPDKQLDLFDDRVRPALEVVPEPEVVELPPLETEPSVVDLRMKGDLDYSGSAYYLLPSVLNSVSPDEWANLTWVVQREFLRDQLSSSFEVLGLDPWDQPHIREGEMALGLKVQAAVAQDGRVSPRYVRVKTGFINGGRFSADRNNWSSVDFDDERVQYYFMVVSEL